MTLRGGYLSGIVTLVAIQLITAFGAIGLLTRMSPAVAQILAENVTSNEAAEEAISSLALALSGTDGDHRGAFDRAISRARQNVTEDEEVPVIDRIEESGHRVLDGETTAVVQAVADARRLIQINRGAMHRANLEAQRLGATGAWAAVALSLVGFFVSVIVVRRSIQGIVEPIEEMMSTLEAFRSGDAYRRCQGRAASDEMRRVLGSINSLLERSVRADPEGFSR